MRQYFQGRGSCQLVSESYRLVCRCRLFDYIPSRVLETVFFDFINICSKHEVKADDKEVWGQGVSLQYPSYNVEVVCVSIRGTDLYLQ